MGTNLVEFYRSKIKHKWKIGFYSTFILGMIVHIYKFTNTLPNRDSLFNYYSSQNMTESGRWFLSFACGLSSYFDLPWITGLFSILFIAVTAVIIVEIFEIENPVLICLCGALLVTFPAVTVTFQFGFTSDGYMLAMLLSALAAYFMTRIDRESKLSYVIATICLCLSCGIYQAYVSFALILSICCMIFYLIDEKYDTKSILLWCAKQLGVYVSALVAYWVIWKLALYIQKIPATDYQGIDAVSLSLRTILSAVPEALWQFVFFFSNRNVFKSGWTLYAFINAIFWVTLFCGLLAMILKYKLYRNVTRLLLLAFALGMLPFAAFIWYFASSHVWYHPVMMQSLCVIYVFAAVLFERFFALRWKNFIGLVLAVFVFYNSIIANISYFYMQRAYEASYATGVEMISRIHQLDTNANKIAVIGNTYDIVRIKDKRGNESSRVPMVADMIQPDLLYNSWNVMRFLNNTYNCNFELVGEDELHEWETSVIVKNMGCWPSSDSIQVFNDVIVIKLDEPENLAK